MPALDDIFHQATPMETGLRCFLEKSGNRLSCMEVDSLGKQANFIMVS